MEVTYEYYLDSYGGSQIPESRWKTLETKMRARLNRYTFDQMSENNWPEQAKTALCEMCECAYLYEKQDGKTSENNDGYSVTYDRSKSQDATLYVIAEVYLSNTGLMDLVVDEE